jgi:para-aminobenzoate synthetase/4-amino-4-deoxychorismate lyase
MTGEATVKLPRGAGTVLFAGGGAWLPRTGSPDGGGPRPAPDSGDARGPGVRGDEALVLSDPCRILVATTPEQIPALLDEVETEQHQGRFVAGYLAYEAGAAFGLTVRASAPDALPLAWLGVYPRESARIIPAAVWRRYLEEIDVSPVAAALAGIRPELSVTRAEYIEAIARVREFIAAGDTYQVNYTVRGRYELPRGALAPASGAASTPGAVEGAAEPIDPLDHFLALVVRQSVPYAAYLDLGDAQIISLSPEMFLRRNGDQLESRPMKGTRPRGTTHAEDVALAYELAETEKERAENLMIVDMVRNDLGRVCRTGSIRVPALYAVEPYRTVWQMVSTVTGDVHPHASLLDIMAAVFPGASITGAPKYHTMEIIATLETEPRDVYTGMVACFYPGVEFTGNIGIRTIIHRSGRCQLGTGSGVVWDAVAGAEYEETLAKAAFATPPPGDTWRPDPLARLRSATRRRPSRAADEAADGAADERTSAATGEDRDEARLFETILLEAEEGEIDELGSALPLNGPVLARYVFLDEHLDRLTASAAEFGYPFERKAMREMLAYLARLTPGTAVVRVELDAGGNLGQSPRDFQPWERVGYETAAVRDPAAAAETAAVSGVDAAVSETAALMISPFRTDPDDPLLRHKTNLRGFYDREYRRAVDRGCLDALFLNRLDLVTEGAISSIAARFDDQWVTPPLEDGLLPGIWRARFIVEKGAVERSLTLPDLLSADEIVVGNSVRGTAQVHRLVADPLVF